MKKKQRIVGIIPVYNPTQEEMMNIEKYVGMLDYCFLLDDSEKDNLEVCRGIIQKYSNVEYYHNKKNMGLCASVNNGFKLAERQDADWILIMNPDGAFQNNAIDIFRAFIEHKDTEKVAIIAPVFNIDRRPRKAGKGYKKIRYADMTGCLYNSKILKELNYYDQRTYFYGLDVEYCLKVNKSGYMIIECSEAVLDHHPAETFCVKFFGKTIFKCGRDTPLRYYYQFRSGYLINQIYHDIYNNVFLLYKFLKAILLFDKKGDYIKMIRLGIKDAKKNYYGKFCD